MYAQGAGAAPLPPWLAPFREARGIGALIDHTLLKAEAGANQIARLCDEAVALELKAVCVHGRWVRFCTERLRGSGVLVATVVGFPLGASATAAKVAETRIAVADGADEVDMVIALGETLAGEWDVVRAEIAEVVAAAGGATVKVILETAALDADTTVRAALAAQNAGAAFVKTSTGFHAAGGATTEAVALLRRTVGPVMGVKASGGVRTADAALAMLRAGADRIGTSGTTAMRAIVGRGAPPLEALIRGG